MTGRALFVLVLSMALLGCSTAPKGWAKRGASADDMERDKAQCTYEAKAATASCSSAPSKPGDTTAMGRAVGDGIVIAEKQIELEKDCMRLHGCTPR